MNGIAATWIGELTKGLPPESPGLDIEDIAGQGWNLLRGDLPLPVAVLRQSALERNEAWMRAFSEHMGVRIAPHAKTTMSSQLIRRQLDQGCWAITVATVHQIRICRAFGIQHIVLANQLIGRQEIDYLIAELKRDPEFEFYCLVDSIAGVEMLKDGIARNDPGRPLNLLVEGGEKGGRTGCRSLDEAMEVARAVHEAPQLALCGVEGYEGLNANADDKNVADFLRFLVEIAENCDRDGLFAADPVLLSAGGSAFFDIVAEEFTRARLSRPTEIIIRSGCYIAHDSLQYARAMERIVGRNPALAKLGPPPPEAALEVWAHVQSRPEAEKAILTMGKRDVSYDVELPVALKWSRPGEAAPSPIPDGHMVTGLNDQHTHLAIPADSPLQVGDMVGFGISHPCTTFDKWQMLYLVDDDYSVIGAIRTWF